MIDSYTTPTRRTRQTNNNLVDDKFELYGVGTWFGTPVVSFEPAMLIVLAPGGFIVLGCCMAAFKAIQARGGAKPAEAHTGCGCCAMAKFCGKTDSEKSECEAK